MTDKTVEELEKLLADAKAKAAHQEYPKYVKVHPDHVHRVASKDGSPDHVSVPAYPEFHVDRDGNVTVLVDNAEEEAKAGSAPKHEVDA